MWTCEFSRTNWRSWTLGIRWMPNKFLRFVAVDLGPWGLVFEYVLPLDEEEK